MQRLEAIGAVRPILGVKRLSIISDIHEILQNGASVRRQTALYHNVWNCVYSQFKL